MTRMVDEMKDDICKNDICNAGNAGSAGRECDMEAALSWYPRMKNQYTALGWKDCYFEFISLWNGDISIPVDAPGRNTPEMKKYLHTQAQFSFWWDERIAESEIDNGPVTQELYDGWKPAIITRRFVKGLEVTETAFVHAPGGKDLARGDDPIYLWLDFKIEKAIEALVPEDEATMYVLTTKRRLRNMVTAGFNTLNILSSAHYAHDLRISGGCLEHEDDGKVRYMFLDGGGCGIELQKKKMSNQYLYSIYEAEDFEMGNTLAVKIPLKDGKASFRLLIPILPVEKSEIEAEARLGYANAFDEAMRYWEDEATGRARFNIPEKIPEYTFKSYFWRMLVIAEHNPIFDEYVLMTGAFSYEALWPTPQSMASVWGLDYTGRHGDAEKYMELYRRDQGNAKPPSDYLLPHKGYFALPDNFLGIRWLNEHGAIMWAACEHYLLSGDGAFWEKWLPALLDACDWIYVQRRNENHPGVKGLIPQAVDCDAEIQYQSVWNDGWTYKGLDSVARVLEKTGHPDAEKWRGEANDYKKRFNEVYMDTCSRTPVWKDADGAEHRFIPIDAEGKTRRMNNSCGLLDIGPMFLCFSGLVDAGSWIFDSALKWFREGPHVKYWRFDGCSAQTPVLYHEMSSCEPGYSWNMDINFMRNDRGRFLEGLYSQFAGARNTDIFSDAESRNGMFTLSCTTNVALCHFRNAIIHEDGNSLELLRMLPAAWAKPSDVFEFADAPTYFGPMDIRIVSGAPCGGSCGAADSPVGGAADSATGGTYCGGPGRVLEIDIRLPEREAPEKITMTIPPFMKAGMNKAIVDGAEYRADSPGASPDYIDLTGKTGRVHITLS